MPKLLTIVVPIYNESQCFPALLARLLQVHERTPGFHVEILFVDDGSSDGSADLLDRAANEHRNVRVIHLSRNFGHQAALTAGVDHADGDYVCIIDGDLQDPPELIPDMLQRALLGVDVVYAQRRTRASETPFKKATAAMFYRMIGALTKVEIPRDTGDFRLMARRVVLAFRRLRESHRFVRGLVPWVGFRSEAFMYDREARYAGETKWPVRKMIGFALNALFSFSNFPLRVATLIGMAMTGLSILGLFVILYLRFLTSFYIPGISAVIFLLFALSGMQFIMLGVFGEYIGRIFEQSKDRPLYVIAATANMTPPVPET